jgi:hypothetical protein
MRRRFSERETQATPSSSSTGARSDLKPAWEDAFQSAKL